MRIHRIGQKRTVSVRRFIVKVRNSDSKPSFFFFFFNQIVIIFLLVDIIYYPYNQFRIKFAQDEWMERVKFGPERLIL